MRVILDSVGNPDLGQNPARRLFGVRRQVVEVASVEEASATCARWIKDNDLGSGNWSGGEVRDERGNMVCRISYNGRAWPSETKKRG